MKILIVGGVAGGASAAARLRRLDEEAEIIMFEKGNHISFANCGLPYYIGGTIKEREKLLVQTPAGMGTRFNLDIRVNSGVTGIDRSKKTVSVLNEKTGETYTESYDRLILSPGAEPVRPPIPGIELPRVYSLRSLDDTDLIAEHLRKIGAGRVVIVGGGFIGLEMAENCKHLGFDVNVIEAAAQLMAPLDPEMANFVHGYLRNKEVSLHLEQSVIAFEEEGEQITVRLKDGLGILADAVVLAIGVRPDSRLAAEAGLELGERGAIRVNDYLQTSDPDIYAVGDAIEVKDFVNGKETYIPLAGPANRQGRLAADNIAGRGMTYKGTLGTSIVKLFDLVAASTGNNEKTLQRLGLQYQKSYTFTASHAGYYPGAIPMNIKLLFDQKGKIYGAQIVGVKGVDKRIDVLATAIRSGLTVFELEELELAYAPPFSSAKDPVNMAGFTAANILRGDVEVIHWHDVPEPLPAGRFVLDVRTPEEVAKGRIKGSVHIPLDEIRERIGEIPRDRELVVACQSGLRSYIPCRILSQKGFNPQNLSGGYHIYSVAWGGSRKQK